MLPLLLGGLGIGGSVLGGIFGSKAEKNKLRMQDRQYRTGLATAQRAEQFGRDVDRRTYADLNPYREAGANALGGMQEWLNEDPAQSALDYTDPGYAFRLQSGSDAVANNAGATGMLKSGDTLRALTEYGQNMGSQEFGNAFNRGLARWQGRGNMLQNMAGMGQAAVGQGAQTGMGAAGVIGNAAATTAGLSSNAMNAMDAGGSTRPWAEMAGGLGGMAMGMAGRMPMGGSNLFRQRPAQNANWLGIYG